MPRGGARPGAGRKPGAATIKTREAANTIAAMGLTPLGYMMGVLNETVEYDEVKFEAAKAAAPYVHPRLANVEAKVTATIRDQSEADLDAEIGALAVAAGLAGEPHGATEH